VTSPAQRSLERVALFARALAFLIGAIGGGQAYASGAGAALAVGVGLGAGAVAYALAALGLRRYRRSVADARPGGPAPPAPGPRRPSRPGRRRRVLTGSEPRPR
jgi:hypothetical protein